MDRPARLRLRGSPGGADILTRRPSWWFSLLRGSLSRRQAGLFVEAHLVFGEDQRALFFAFVAPVQKSAAHQRQILQPDAISPNQAEIGSDRKLGPEPVVPDALKREHPEAHVLSESSEDILHRCAPFKALLRPFGVRPAHHEYRDKGRLQVGPYSDTRRPWRPGRFV